MWEGAERRRAGLLMGGLLLLLALLLAWLAYGEIAAMVRSLMERRPTLGVTGAAFAMPPLALVLAGWAVWSFKAMRAPPSGALEARLLFGSLGALAVMAATPFAVTAWAENDLPRRGYRPCPDETGRGRFRTVTWANDATPCPRRSG